MEAYDIMGNSATDSLVVGVDSTSPQVQSHTFEKNIGSGESKLPHSSRSVYCANVELERSF